VLGRTLNLYQKALYGLSCRGKITELLTPTGEIIMQRMEVMIRYVDDEDQVLSESNMSFQTLDVDSISREERLDQLESDTLDIRQKTKDMR
jgi:hypothetical protein